MVLNVLETRLLIRLGSDDSGPQGARTTPQVTACAHRHSVLQQHSGKRAGEPCHLSSLEYHHHQYPETFAVPGEQPNGRR